MQSDLIEQVIRAQASEKNVEPTQLDIELENHIPTDVINELESHESNSWQLQFETQNHVIEISGDDTVEIQ